MRVRGVLTWALVALACFAATSSVVSAEDAAPVATDAAPGGEKFEFQAEVSRLMDIIINSLYQKKEIFLREVISNASDALDKLRFLALSDPNVMGDNKELEIRVSFDSEANTLTIRDTGVGMTKADLIQNLGTVAKSGTTQFVEAAAAGGDLSLIGQFGVGFYSVYLVADRVTVRSKHNDDDQYVWSSTADSSFTVDKDTSGKPIGRGTEITLHLKEDATDFANQDELTDLLKRYSEFISFPIYLNKSKVETVEEDDDEEDDAEDGDDEDDDDDEEEDDSLDVEDESDAETKEKKTKEVTTWSWEQMNTQSAIWTRSPSDVTPEEYREFYKVSAKEYDDPMAWVHFKAEGEVEFKSVMFIPKVAPRNLMENYYTTNAALKLYVRKVLITDELDLLPRYLNFIRGVVDSDDLPLNVSRETLQQHKVLKVMGKKLVRKVLELLKKISEATRKKELKALKDENNEDDEDEDEDDDDDEDEDDTDHLPDYNDFYEHFGKNIKLGVMEDQANRGKLVKLLRFHSTHNETSPRTALQDYADRMPDWQKSIYYIAGESIDAVLTSPFLMRAKAKNVEVLLLVDPIDEYCVQNIPDFDGLKMQSLTKEGVKFGDETDLDKRRVDMYSKNFKELTTWMKKLFGDKIEKVVVAKHITHDPSVLLTGQFGYSANMERIVKSQTMGKGATGANAMMARKTMEINPRHPIVDELAKRVASDPEDETAQDLCWVLYDTALLNSGFQMDSPSKFAARMYRMIKSGLSLDSLELLPEIDVPEEEEPVVEEPEAEEEEAAVDVNAAAETVVEEVAEDAPVKDEL